MITLINKESLYNSFGVDKFINLELAIESMAPSLVEYYLSSLCEYAEDIYFNKREIENSISLGEYNLYKDYNSNIYLEINTIEQETDSLW
ncbi:hypothetical protein GCM10012288_04590 [Malaciobacter pacificus]|jgi:hypothetical protein|uniref:Uncharacterized protein n=1 Tax=Malaciobacter pacificus TaxID=1080223 RepID=A0A5C2H6F1_9BACT|nr:hypothetical protein [Malaciobacter pacificus]QEP34541.1 hypothetical protein APAC_1432 [Malaciobacter pacificus]GGD33711.1 hypothetical protein GCM10012288_04590 [Malaciobacter pacificus]